MTQKLAQMLRGAHDALKTIADEIKRDKDGKFASGSGSSSAAAQNRKAASEKAKTKPAPISTGQKTAAKLQGNAAKNAGASPISSKRHFEMREAGRNAAIYGSLEKLTAQLKERGASKQDIDTAVKAYHEQAKLG